jgi:hypothetical protein
MDPADQREPDLRQSIGPFDVAHPHARHADEANAVGQQRGAEAGGHAGQNRERRTGFLHDPRLAAGLPKRFDDLRPVRRSFAFREKHEPPGREGGQRDGAAGRRGIGRRQGGA